MEIRYLFAPYTIVRTALLLLFLVQFRTILSNIEIIAGYSLCIFLSILSVIYKLDLKKVPSDLEVDSTFGILYPLLTKARLRRFSRNTEE